MRIDAEHRQHLKVDGHRGTWYVVAESHHLHERVYLLEHERYGDEAAHIIVTKDLKVIMEDVWNGFSDLTLDVPIPA